MEEKKILEGLKNVKDAISSQREELKEELKKRDQEISELGQAKEETGKRVGEITEKLEDLESELKDRVSEIQENYEDVLKEKNRFPMGGQGSGRVKTIGEQFVNSDAYKKFDPNVQSSTPQVEVKGVQHALRTVGNTKTIDGSSLDDLPQYLYETLRVPGYFYPPERVERVRDLLNVVPTQAGAIDYVVETGFTNEAAPVGEFDADDETNKPKSGIEFDVKQERMKTIAHWLPATKQIIADASVLQNHINNRLLYGLALEEDDQLLLGDGTGDNLQGIMTATDVQTYDWSDGAVGDTKIDAIRRAMTKALVAEYPVSGVVLSNEDWEDIELQKGNDGHYIWVTVMDGGQPRLWRAPVVVTNAMDEGQFLTGAFEMGAELYDRESAMIRITDSHKDFFTKNLYAILAEERLALALYRPESFVVGNFDSEPSN